MINRFKALFKGRPASPTHPDNLSADAALVLNNACRAVSKILARRAAMDRTGLKGETLFVLAGEIHDRPGDHVHHMAVIDRLRKKEKIAVCCETEHNFLSLNFTKRALRKPDASMLAWMRERDRLGEFSLKNMSAFHNMRYAEYSNTALWAFLLRHKVPVRFTDVAVMQGPILSECPIDISDPTTAESMSACFGKATAGISWVAHDGVFVRNYHMAVMAQSFARTFEPRILLQECGDAHIAGEEKRQWPMQQSLASIFNSAKAAFIAMPLSILDAGLRKNGLRGYEKIMPGPMPKITVDENDPAAMFKTREEESVYLNGLLERAELAAEKLALEDYRTQRIALQAEMHQFFDECLRAHAAPGAP